MLSDDLKAQAIKTLENILRVMHKKQYDEILQYVDEFEFESVEVLADIIALQGYDSFDEYGTYCDFNPQYEYFQTRFYEYNDGSGFAVEHDLTSDEEMTDIVLHLEFLYDGNNLIKRFISIDM